VYGGQFESEKVTYFWVGQSFMSPSQQGIKCILYMWNSKVSTGFICRKIIPWIDVGKFFDNSYDIQPEIK
jgi:hypothetical protein